MKKLLPIIAIFLLASFGMSAQPKAFGLRAGWGLEISYQHDLYPGFFQVDMGVTGVGCHPGARLGFSYDFNLINKKILGGNFNFFLGPGCMAALYDQTKFAFAVLPHMGVQYTFIKIPLQIGMDTKPLIWIGEENGFDVPTLIPMACIRWRF